MYFILLATQNWMNFPSKIPTVEHLFCRTARWVLLFSVIWTLPDPIGHSNILILKSDDVCVNNFQFSGLKASWCNSPAPGTSSFIGPAPGHFLLCKSPGAGHTFWCKSPGVPGGMVTGQIDTCINFSRALQEISAFHATHYNNISLET